MRRRTKDVVRKTRDVRRLDIVRFIFYVIFVFLFSSLIPHPSSFVSSAHAAPPTQVCFNHHCLTVEIADTIESRARGLQGRASLPKDHGILFVFSSEELVSFWMKDTLIPLDMIWINDRRKIVDIKTDVPLCEKEPCPIYVPSANARYVLEANAHFAQAHGLKVGDQVVIK